MARHSVKEVEDAAVDLLCQPNQLSYLLEKPMPYEHEIEDLIDTGEILDGPRIWTFYGGSEFPRGDDDNAWNANEAFSLSIVCYDHNYAGAVDAAGGDATDPKHPGTRQMIEDVKDRLMARSPFPDAMPFILVSIERVRVEQMHISAYIVNVSTEFDYFGPVAT